MPTPLEVLFANRGLKDIADNLNKAADAFDKAGAAATRANSVATGGGSGSGSARSRGGGGVSGTGFAMGANQKLANLQRQQFLAQASGNTAASADLSYLIAKTQAQQKAQSQYGQPKTFAQKLSAVVSSSRFGAGGVMPLIGKTAELFGDGASAMLSKAAPAIAIAVAATKVAKAFFDLADKAAGAANSFSKFESATGSTGGAAGVLRGMGASVGMTPENIGSLAQAFQERITSDPMAMGTANAMGIHNLPGPFGDQDWGKQLVKAIDALRKITDRTEQIRTARILGLESALQFTKISNRQYEKVKASGMLSGEIFDKDYETKAADFESAKSRVGQGAENIQNQLGKPYIEQFTPLLNAAADAMDWTSKMMKNYEGIGKSLETTTVSFLNPFLGALETAWDAGKALLGGGDAKDAQTKALEDNTDAINGNTSNRKGLPPGTYGVGGDRFNGGTAIPAGFQGQSLREMLQAGGIRNGAF